jgi:uncharacterized protein YndB with AHSA1/START domain
MGLKKKQRQIEKIGRVTADSVFKHTKKDWDTWIPILDRAGAQLWQHKEIAAYLTGKYKLSPWWRQIVASAYEQHYGKRIEGVSSKGFYFTASSKTFYVSATKLWQWLISAEGQQVWLQPMVEFEFKKGIQFEIEGGIVGEIRTLVPSRKIRIRWLDEDYPKPSFVEILLTPRNKEKCAWHIVHGQIPNSRAKLNLKDRWKTALERAFLATNGKLSKKLGAPART